MREQQFGTKPLISFNGSRLSAPFDDQISAVVVDQDLTSPMLCEVTITDPNRDFLSSTGLELGQSISAEASAVAEDQTESVFEGVVHAIDVTFDDDGQSVVIIGFDDSYRLTQQRLSRSFNDVTVSDVINSICADLKVDVGKVELDQVVFVHLGLFNETPWEFIRRHAAASGCVVQFKDGALQVVKPSEASAGPDPGDHGAKEPNQLVPGHNLTQLRVHSTTARQVGEVEVRGWDPAEKKALVAASPGQTTVNQSVSKPAEVGSKFGAAKLVEPRADLDVQSRCDHHAKALASFLASQHRFADGEALGDPALSAGAVISLGAVDSLSGKYLMTQCRHRFDDDGYATEFRCSGVHDRSLLGLLVDSPLQKVTGVHPAIVTDLADPDELGRVRLKFPWLGEEYESNWARVCQQGAGPERGLLWFPEVDDEVAVVFLDGVPAAPMVIGGLFNGKDSPPFASFLDTPAGQVQARGMKTRAGHTIELVDEGGKESVKLQSADENVTVHLDQANNKLSLESGGDISIEAGGDITLKGKTINLN